MISDLKYFLNIILKQWKLQIKNLTDFNDLNNIKAEKHTAFVNDFDLDLNDDILHSILNSVKSIQNLAY